MAGDQAPLGDSPGKVTKHFRSGFHFFRSRKDIVRFDALTVGKYVILPVRVRGIEPEPRRTSLVVAGQGDFHPEPEVAAMKFTQKTIDDMGEKLAGRLVQDVAFSEGVLRFTTNGGVYDLRGEGASFTREFAEALSKTLSGRKIWRVTLVHGTSMNILTDDEEGWSTALN